MREIKFRGLDINGRWWYGSLVQSLQHSDGVEECWIKEFTILGLGGVSTPTALFHEVDPETVEQFTGLRDKNGKEIYEGDIVLTSLFFEGHRLPHQGIVVYSSEYGSFGTQNESGITLVHNHAINDREVIGNIHKTRSY